VCDRILLSTDDPEAVRQAEAAGVEVHHRSAEAASDTATINDVISNLMCDHALDGVDIVVLLQPTSPLRHPSVIDRAVLLLQELRASAVVSVQPLDGHEPHLSRILRQTGPYLHPVGYGWDIRRQDASLGHYRDGQVYAFWVDTWRLYRHIYGEHVRPLICAAADALSIDTEADWQEAERRIREREHS
jgi:N-acylneuraminate cytidylyltransferase